MKRIAYPYHRKVPVDYKLLSEYLKGGRNKRNRPLYYGASGTWRVEREDSSTIVIYNKWSRNYPYICPEDRGVVLRYRRGRPVEFTNLLFKTTLPGFYSLLWFVGIPATIHAGFFEDSGDSYSREYGIWSIGESGKHTPSKIHKCRACHGSGEGFTWCVAGRYCRPYISWCGDPRKEYLIGAFLCLEHAKPQPHETTPQCEHGKSEPHTIECNHGVAKTQHKIFDKNTKCWNCGATGKVEHGNKAIHKRLQRKGMNTYFDTDKKEFVFRKIKEVAVTQQPLAIAA